MKITFTAKIIADVSNDERNPEYPFDTPTMEWVGVLLEKGKCTIEYVPCWDNSVEPTLIITENIPASIGTNFRGIDTFPTKIHMNTAEDLK